MQITRPDFYKEFSCIAGSCPDTCCAGWQIMIDKKSLKKYQKLKGPFRNRLHNDIDWSEQAFRQYDHRCAFLNEKNLCDIYSEAGADMLCDTCRKRFPASAVIPDDTDTRSARSSAHKHGSVSGKKRPAARQQAFFDDPLNGPEIYHSTAAAMRSMRKNVPEAEEAEAQKKTTEKKETEKVSTDKPFSGNESSVQEHAPVPEPVISSGQEDEPAAKPTPVSKNDTAGTKSDVSSDDVTSPDQLTNPKKKHKKSLPFIILILILIIIAVIFLFPKMHTSSDNSSGTSTPKKTADATKEIYKQNETAAYNGIEITMDSYVESEGDDWSVPTEGNEFMFVHMTIVNQTSDDLVISSMASFENYCDDTKLDYSAAAFTALATTSDQPKLDGTIAPGETLEGYLSLEVPLNWSTIEIRYTDKIWSDDAIHFQIKRQE